MEDKSWSEILEEFNPQTELDLRKIFSQWCKPDNNTSTDLNSDFEIFTHQKYNFKRDLHDDECDCGGEYNHLLIKWTPPIACLIFTIFYCFDKLDNIPKELHFCGLKDKQLEMCLEYCNHYNGLNEGDMLKRVCMEIKKYNIIDYYDEENYGALLYWAIRFDCVEAVVWLTCIEMGLFSSPDRIDIFGISALELSIRMNNLILVKYFLDEETINEQFESDITPLALAQYYNYNDIVEYLIDNGANNNNDQYLFESLNRNVDFIKLLQYQ